MKATRWLSLALVVIVLLGNGVLVAGQPPQERASLRPPIVQIHYAPFSASPPTIDGAASKAEWGCTCRWC
jgi:hypothetical protein